MWSLSTEFGSEADLDPDERPSSSRKRSVDITALHAAVPMSNSSSDSDFLRDADDLPFGLELEGLNINESPRAPGSTSPWKPRDASGWASTQGLVGRYAKVLRVRAELLFSLCTLKKHSPCSASQPTIWRPRVASSWCWTNLCRSRPPLPRYVKTASSQRRCGPPTCASM